MTEINQQIASAVSFALSPTSSQSQKSEAFEFLEKVKQASDETWKVALQLFLDGSIGQDERWRFTWDSEVRMFGLQVLDEMLMVRWVKPFILELLGWNRKTKVMALRTIALYFLLTVLYLSNDFTSIVEEIACFRFKFLLFLSVITPLRVHDTLLAVESIVSYFQNLVITSPANNVSSVPIHRGMLSSTISHQIRLFVQPPNSQIPVEPFRTPRISQFSYSVKCNLPRS
jgi:hypothetical protein